MRRGRVPDYLDPEKNLFYGKLQKAFPQLYEDVRCGVCVGDGWHDLVWETSKKMHDYLSVVDEGLSKVRIVQVKQKFCTLRIYIRCKASKEILENLREIIAEAGRKSMEICEECGGAAVFTPIPGLAEPVMTGTLLCSDCRKKLRQKHAPEEV